MDNMSIYEAARECPQDALKPITAGRLKGKSDINPMWRIKKLTEIFGACGIGWYYTIDKQWIECSEKENAAFCNISLYVKADGEWSKPIIGTGGSMFVAQEKNGAYTSDEAFKMALTDAISVACKALGFAADVYWNTDSTKYNRQAAQPAQQPIPAQAKQPAQTARVITAEQGFALMKRIKADNIDSTKLLALYKVEMIKDLTVTQYANISDNWDKIKERCV